MELYVGYRIYTEEGTKTDLKGKKFEGWSESFDEYISAYSLRIQRYFFSQKFIKIDQGQ